VSGSYQETYGERSPAALTANRSPAMVSAVVRDDGVTVLLPDSVLNVVYRFEWTAP